MIVKKVHLDLWDFEELIGTIESIIPAMEKDRDGYEVEEYETMEGFNKNAYQYSNEIYILGKCLDKLRAVELKLKKSHRQLVGMTFTQVEIDVMVQCICKYTGAVLSKLDEMKQYASLSGSYYLRTQKLLGNGR